MRICWLALILCSLVLVLTLRAAPSAESMRFNSATLRCGPAALYVFLVMCGHEEMSFSQLDDIPIGPNGSSLLSLKQAAARMNVDTEIRSFMPQDIDNVPLPAIAAFRWWGHDALPDHYLVIHKVDDEMVHMVDGLYAQEVHFPRSRVASSWSGIALIRKQPPASRLPVGRATWWMLMLVVLDMVLLAYVLRRCRAWWHSKSHIGVP